MGKVIRTSTVPLSLNILLKGQLNYLNRYYDIVAVSGEGRELDEVKARENVEIYAIEMRRSISPFKDFISLITLVLYFRKEKPLIVHSITPKAGLLSMLAAKLAGVPIRIHTFTGLIFPSKSGIMQKLLIQMDKLLCSCATNIYPEGEGVKEDLLRFGITNKELKVIANGNVNGIDSNYFNRECITEEYLTELKMSLKYSPEDLVFVFVGRLVGDKGINELVSAFNNLNEKHSQTKLLLIGPFEEDLDPLESETLDEIDRNTSIMSLGYQSDVRPFFAVSDALAFPSYREGFPNVVMQAGAMGLPSIVSDINGCNEIIIEEENGVIVPSKDKDALYRAMLRFVEDKELFNKLKSNARRMVVDRYEQQVVWDALLSEYRRLEENVQKRN